VLVTVEAHHPDALADVSAAVRDLEELLRVRGGAENVETGILNRDQLTFGG
jgi:hypothetical protein